MLLLAHFVSLVCLAWASNAVAQTPLANAIIASATAKAITTPDPAVTNRIKSIFSNSAEKTGLLETHLTACCDPSCPVGHCNGHGPTPPSSGRVSRTATARFSRITIPCCNHTCADGLCRPSSLIPTHAAAKGRDPRAADDPDSEPLDGRDTGPTCPTVCLPGGRSMGTIWRAVSAPIETPPTGTADNSNSDSGSDFLTQFHARELTGQNQDTLPMIVENGNHDPTTLIADIDLALTESYMSGDMLSVLGLVDNTTKTGLTTSISTKDRQQVALGIDGYLVTPTGRIELDILIGSVEALRHFRGVVFNVFEFPETGGTWQPEVFLGVDFLRRAGALRLAEAFAGKGVVEGVPVLVREVGVVDEKVEKRKEEERDEL